MPNWVYNGLTIEGNPEIVKALMEQMNKPFSRLADDWNMDTKQMEVTRITYSAPVFAFHNIYSHIDAGITDEEYVKQPIRSALDVSDPNWWADTERLRLEDKSWYSWNITNWGVKWDVAVSDNNQWPDTTMEDDVNGENHVVYYNFNTAWAPPIPAIQKLSAQYPSLLFTLSYEEETGWGGEMEVLRGEIISESEYGWQCRECDHVENETPYCDTCEFDMCPNCGYGEPDDENRAECQTHKIELDPSRKEANV
jgi:hypothetical protein